MNDFEVVAYPVFLAENGFFVEISNIELDFSMKTAVADLKLERLWVVYPGKASYRLTEKIQVIPLADVRDTWNYG